MSRIIAHRGARSLAPENTLAAARAALAVGADGWEVDVALSADGVPFLLHDPLLTRTTDAAQRFPDRAPWLAHTFTWAELQTLDAGSWFARDDPFGQLAAGVLDPAARQALAGEPLPSLEAALRSTREHGWWINVEVKDLRGLPGDGVVVERVVALIERLGMADGVLLSSFNHDYLRRARAASPGLALGALVSHAPPDPVALCRALDARAYHPAWGALDPTQIGPLQRAGCATNVWTVNEPAAMEQLRAYGVAGIITDFPQWG